MINNEIIGQEVFNSHQHNSNDWDDSIILQVFHDSVASYPGYAKNTDNLTNSMKKSKKNQNKHDKGNEKRIRFANELTKERIANESKLGSWEAVISKNELESQVEMNSNEEKNRNIGFPHSSQTIQYEQKNLLVDVDDTNALQSAHQDLLQAWYNAGYQAGRYDTLCERLKSAKN